MALITDMGIPGVGSGIWHPKHQNMYRVLFSNFGGGTNSNAVSMQAINVSRPKKSFETIVLDRYVSRAKIPGKYTFEPINVVIQDDLTSQASAIIQEQEQRQQWLIGAEGQWMATGGEGSLYKFVMHLDQLDGNEQVIEQWIYEGCWIQNVDYGENDYSTADPLAITMTIEIDHARQVLGGYDRGEGVAIGGPGRNG